MSGDSESGGWGSEDGERDAFGNPVAPGGAQGAPGSSRPARADEDEGTLTPPPPPPPPPSSFEVAPGDWPAPTAAPPPPPPPPAGDWAPPAAPVAAPPSTAAPNWVGAVTSAEPASWGSRVLASLVDSVLVVAVFMPAAFFFISGPEGLGALLFFLAFAWTFFLYAPIFMMRGGERNGQTLGKQVLGIRVVRASGQPVDFGYALLRELGIKTVLIGGVGSFFLSLPTLLNYLWPLWDEQGRAFHDMIASSRVFRTR